MGWSNCGLDSEGRPIGYGVEAVCDESGCYVSIDRGLSYACGGEHGEYDGCCEKYFCENHVTWPRYAPDDFVPHTHRMCRECAQGFDDAYVEDLQWQLDIEND